MFHHAERDDYTVSFPRSNLFLFAWKSRACKLSRPILFGALCEWLAKTRCILRGLQTKAA